MTKYEYRIVILGKIESFLNDNLTKYGNVGFHVVGVTSSFAIMEREILDDDWTEEDKVAVHQRLEEFIDRQEKSGIMST